MSERRVGERLPLPEALAVHVRSVRGGFVGRVRVVAPGGVLVTTDEPFVEGKTYDLYLVAESEGIHRRVRAVMRYRREAGIVLAFEQLEWGAALEVGRLIGKFYSAPAENPESGVHA